MWIDPGTYLDELLDDGRYDEAAAFLSGLVIPVDGGTSTRKLPSNADVVRHLQNPPKDG